MRSIRALALVAPFAIACAPALLHATREDAAWAARTWLACTPSDLAEGRATYVRKCGNCHNLHLPNEYRPEQWACHVQEMVADAEVTEREATLITWFLMATSRPDRTPSSTSATTAK